MKTIKYASVVLLSLFTNSVFALESLPEDELALATGQDGVVVDVGLPAIGWIINSIGVSDSTGIPNTIKPGYDFFRADLIARNIGMKTCTEATINGTCTSIASPSIRLAFDTTGDANNNATTDDPMISMTLSLINGAKKFRFYIDKIALRNGSALNETTFLDFNHSDGVGDYYDILPVGAGTLLTMQLANENSGHLLHFNNANFGTIDFGSIVLRDKTDTVNGGACAACNMSFGFKLDNVDLTGAGLDLSSEGLVFSAASFVTPLDITFSNIKVGNTITGTNTATDMGTMGIKGLQVTNFTFTIAGKS